MFLQGEMSSQTLRPWTTWSESCKPETAWLPGNCHRNVTSWWLTLASLFFPFKKPLTQRSSWSGSEAGHPAINPYWAADSHCQSLAFCVKGTWVLCSATTTHGRDLPETAALQIRCILLKFQEQMYLTCCSRSENIKIRSLEVWGNMVAMWHLTVRCCAQLFFEWNYALWNRLFHCPNTDICWEARKDLFYSFKQIWKPKG